jgi:hypothetical protein
VKNKMNKKIIFSGISILASFGMLAGSAFAAFTTSATAQGNTFSATTPNLEVTVNGVGPGTTEPGAIVTGLIPGTPGATQTFVLTNTDVDTTADMPVSLQFNLGATNTLPGADLSITVNCGGSDITDTYGGWLSTPHPLGTVPHQGGALANTLSCTMIPTLNSGVGNGDAGTSAVFDAVFTGTLGN